VARRLVAIDAMVKSSVNDLGVGAAEVVHAGRVSARATTAKLPSLLTVLMIPQCDIAGMGRRAVRR
jgi:hypothetical protein